MNQPSRFALPTYHSENLWIHNAIAPPPNGLHFSRYIQEELRNAHAEALFQLWTFVGTTADD